MTAKHVVDMLSHDNLTIYDRAGHELPGLGTRLPSPTNSNYDVAIFRFSDEVPEYFGTSLEPCVHDDVMITQSVFFLGFPVLGPGLDYVQPNPNTPICKRANVAGQAADNDGTTVWLLDGLTTGGFSGGPVITRQEPGDNYKVFAVLSAYVPAKNDDEKPPKGGASVDPTANSIQENSGLVVGFSIRHALKAIDQSLGGSPRE